MNTDPETLKEDTVVPVWVDVEKGRYQGRYSAEARFMFGWTHLKFFLGHDERTRSAFADDKAIISKNQLALLIDGFPIHAEVQLTFGGCDGENVVRVTPVVRPHCR